MSLRSSKADVFSYGNLKDFRDYLESSVFEPMEGKSLVTCRYKALILMKLATGRKLEDIQALESWEKYRSKEGALFLKFKPYEGWKGKAVSIDSSWRPKDVTLYAIDEVEGKDLSALGPRKAFRIFSNMQSAQGSSQRLWLHGSRPNGFLSRAVIKVIEESMIVAFHSPQQVVSPFGNSPLEEM